MRERKVPQVRTDERPEVATLGEYHMLRRLDSGRTVEVYLAEQGGSRDQPVAVKVVRAVDGSQAALSAEAREAAVGRFLREAHVLSRLAHPNILPVYDAGFENGSLYLAMQYVPDGSLADAIRRRSRHPLRLPAMVPLVIELIDQLASALQYAHDRGIVHGAVRPSNVLVEFGLDAYPHLLLADFGIARELAPAIAGAHAATSAAYMAPEQFGGRALPASDQYALAALAYLLLTKRTPFQGDAAAQTFGHLYGTAPPAHTLKGAVPSEASEVLGRALAKDPRERFPSVTDFAEALREATSESEAALLLGEDALDAHAEAATGTQVTQPDGVPVPGDAPPQGTDASALRGASAESASHRRGRKPIAWIAVAALLMLVLAADVTMNPQQLPQGLGPPAAAAIPSPTATSPPSPTEGLATGDAASITQLAAPAAVLPGQQFTVHITFANTGATTWTDGAGYRLVCDAVRHPQQNCPSRMDVTLAGMTIAPGRTTRFTLTLVAPREPGTYQTWVNLSRNGTLFPTPDAHITVTVAPAAPPVAPATPTPRPPTPRPTAVPPTATPRPNPTPTTPPAPSATPAPTTTPTPVPQPTPTTTPAPTPTAAPSPSPTLAPTPTAESTATSSPAPTAEPTSTAAPTRSPSPTAVPTPVLEPTPTPSPFDM